ncbi:MAG: PrsW family intramembrane metalloprotease [Sandaracinaceae bacterium]|nr:PrsW family intramembrane metalloprotease [Sandaracinaceae bacterium]
MSRSRTWSQTFLGVTAAMGLGVGVVSAAIAGYVSPRLSDRPVIPESTLGFLDPRAGADEPAPLEEWLDPWLANPGTDFADVIEAVPWLCQEPRVGGVVSLVASLERSLPEDRPTDIAVGLALALGGDLDRAAWLRDRAMGDDPPPYANLALAVAIPPSETRVEALEREVSLHDSDAARRLVLATLSALGSFEAIDEHLRDPRYASVADARLRYERAHRRLDWVGMLQWVGPAQYADVSTVFIALGAVSGLIWLMVLAYVGDVRTVRSARLALCLAGLGLGALSTIPTLVLSVWMEEVLGVVPADSIVGGFTYYIGSVGLREELCKLAAFLPLAPLVIRRGDPREALLVAGCVGLGFAAEENVSYFAASGAADVAGRFLTANFGHAVTTGLAGAWLCRAVKQPKRFPEFLLVLLALIIGHGVYDALIAIPDVADWSILGGTVYVAAALFYFEEIHACPRVEPRRVPATAVFVYGLVAMIGCSLVAASWALGFEWAVRTSIPSLLGAALFTFVFFRAMREPLLP